MSRPLLLSLIVIALVCGGGYFWWQSQPSAQVNRQLDILLDAMRFEKLSLKQKEDRHDAIREVFAPQVSLIGEGYFPNEDFNQDQFISRMDDAHAMITLLKIEELERQIDISGSEARALLTLTVTVAAGPDFKKTQNWQLAADFEKTAERWQITAMQGTPR